jgi:DHA1 family L-arabinose/isopropyl-beta-D-thiogalactopyranoside export protein-like MFS transporter/DHA1 family inner membrane transport protein
VRRYTLLVISCALAVTGFETAYTYITPYLVEVSKFSSSTLAPLLLIIGAAGVVGTLAVGRFLDAHPWPAMVVPLALVAGGLLALYGGGHMRGATVVALLPVGLGFSAYAAAMQSATLLVAPGSTDIASAGTSTAFNVGIAAGSFLGGALIGGPGLRSVALVGAVITVLAAAALLVPGRRPSAPTTG